MSDIMQKRVSRRTLLRIGGCAGISVATCGVTGGIVATQTDMWDRIRGISHTPRLENPDAWAYSSPTLTLDLALIPELAEPSSAVQLDEDALPDPLLIVHGSDAEFYVFINKCPHGGRKIDLKSDGKLLCTSISRSSFDYEGTVLDGPAEEPLTVYELAHEGDQLTITLA